MNLLIQIAPKRGYPFFRNLRAILLTTGRFKVYNPADGSLVADDIPIAGEADVNAAVEAAENAFPAWKRIDHLQRRSILLKFANLLADHDQELCDLTRITNGRPVSQQYETLYAVETFR
jgi:aldehyde dehydrogenase (NAD+)